MAEQAEHKRWWQGLTRYHWMVLIVAWLGWVFDIFDTALFNFAKGPMLAEMLGPNATNKEAVEGMILMIFLFGWALGGFGFGILADRWGRTRTMIVTILIYCAFTGLTAFCQTWEQVAAARFLTALGLGGEWAAGAALIAEVFPNRARAGAAALLQSAAAFGPALAAVANLQVKADDWRILFYIGVAPALLTVFIRFGIKEPERWEKSQKRTIGGWLQPAKDLFAVPRWRRNVIIATIIGVVGIAGATNISYWNPNLVEAASAGLSKEVIQERKSHALLILHIGTLAGVLIVPWLCEVISRKRTLLLFFIAAPLSILVVAQAKTSYETLLWIGPLLSFFSIGISSAFVLYFPELFPTRLRATGAGFAYNVGRLAAAPFPWLTGLLIGGAKGDVAVGFARAAFIYLIGILAIPFAPETKGEPLPEDDSDSEGPYMHEVNLMQSVGEEESEGRKDSP